MIELIKSENIALASSLAFQNQRQYLEKYRPFSYDEDKLILRKGCCFSFGCSRDAVLAVNNADMLLDPLALLDQGGSFEVGSDYFLYLCLDEGNAKLVVSKNGTFPLGAKADGSLRIGGFHYGSIRKVSADGSWTPIDSEGKKFGSGTVKWQDNVTVGIVPNSVWDMKNRPATLFGGMVKVGKIWVCIYQASKRSDFTFMEGDNLVHVADGELQSKYGMYPVSGIDGLCQYNFAELAARSGMRMLKYSEWLAAAYGAPQGQSDGNTYGWCDESNKIRARTGCSVDPETGKYDGEKGIKPYAISAYNVVDTTGNVWEWLSEYTNRHDAPSGEWGYYDQLGPGMGQIYGWKVDSFSSFAAGGHWHRGSYCGPRAINPDDQPWKVNVHIGTRLACDPI